MYDAKGEGGKLCLVKIEPSGVTEGVPIVGCYFGANPLHGDSPREGNRQCKGRSPSLVMCCSRQLALNCWQVRKCETEMIMRSSTGISGWVTVWTKGPYPLSDWVGSKKNQGK